MPGKTPLFKRLSEMTDGINICRARRNGKTLYSLSFQDVQSFLNHSIQQLLCFANCYSHQTVTRGHTAKLVKNRCRLDLRQHFFSERVVDRWNGLDQCVIDSATVNSFKNGLR